MAILSSMAAAYLHFPLKLPKERLALQVFLL